MNNWIAEKSETSSSQCGCGDYHRYNIKEDDYEECVGCGCKLYPDCA